MTNVLHIWRYYGQRSQTWLYRQLSAQMEYRPHLMLREQWLENAYIDEFPFPAEQLHYFPERNVVQRTLNRAETVVRTGRRDTFTCADAREIKRVVRVIGADIIHVHFGWTAVKMLPYISSSLIVSFYGSDVFRLSVEYKKQLEILLQSPVRIIVTSNALKSGLIDIGGIADNITVIPVGINVDELPSVDDVLIEKSTKNNGADDCPLKIFTVGRLIDCKAPDKLPVMARMLLDKGIEFEWTVAGDGPLMEKCRQAIDANGVGDCFLMVGSVSFDDVKRYMLDSDILVHNAVVADDGSREALGVTLMEAGALGVPVVSCDVGGIPEVVVNGETGILVEEGDVEVMVDAIERLAGDAGLRQGMGVEAMRYVRARFDARMLAEKVERFYGGLAVLCGRP
jgi:glycosyltransferase involved in cell wall biosynthesis